MDQYKAQNAELIEKNREKKRVQEKEVREQISRDTAEWERHRIELREQRDRRDQELRDFAETQLRKIEKGEDLKNIQFEAPEAPAAPLVIQPKLIKREVIQLPQPKLSLQEIDLLRQKPLTFQPTSLGDAHAQVARLRALEACADSLFMQIE